MIKITKEKDAAIAYLERDKKINLNILGYLRNFKDADVYIYNDQIENGVIIGDEGLDFFFLSTSDTDFLAEFWDSLPTGHKCFSGVERSVAEVFQKGKEVVWANPCKVYVHSGEFQRASDSRYVVESLTAADAEEVDKYYTFRSDDSIHGIRESIVRYDSSCIRVDGRLASWCLTHDDTSMGPLYTKEQYRESGMAWVVTSFLMDKLIAKGIIPFVQILDNNSKSLDMAGKIKGMEYTHDCLWFGVEK